MTDRRPSPPGGHRPPPRAELPDGTSLDLEALAAEICRRFRVQYPDEEDRYGEVGNDWCVHDNQHLLNWAAVEAQGFGRMDGDVRWLAGVLDARSYPLDRLAHDLDIAADVVAERAPGAPPQVAAALRRCAGLVRELAPAAPA